MNITFEEQKSKNSRQIQSEDLFFRDHNFLETKIKKSETDLKVKTFF